MGVTWTEEQQQVIRFRNRNILVSAAAGSGKTAVLVERILTRLTADEPPLSVDHMLIVTFTEAAAAEMKERIRDAIEARLAKEPDNVHLQRQATLIDHAQITTIHSFCLMVIREHFSDIDLDPGFRIAEEGELKLLKRDVADALLNTRYEEGAEEFLRLADTFAPGRNDEKLTELLLTAFEFAGSFPDPAEWLHYCAEVYQGAGDGTFFEKIAEETEYLTADMERLLQYGIAVCREEEGPVYYEEALASDLEQIRQVREADGYDRTRECLQQIRWQRLSGKKMPEASEEKKNTVKAVREQVKDMVSDLREQYYDCSLEQVREDMRSMYPVVQEFTRLVEDFSEAFAMEKRSRNVIDFQDMEHFALQILTRKEKEGFVPSEAAGEYQERYDEIMIDEYQDSNLIQETLLTSVSRISQGSYNVFMVGDVKQSIYRFRLARPELFMEKFHTYDLTDSQTQRIDLSRNFRSRREVLDSTNFIFRQLMQEQLGGIAYDDRAALYVGANYEPVSGNETEVLLIRPREEEKSRGTGSQSEEMHAEETEREREARVVAGRIRQLVGQHPVRDKKTGEMRSARYGDIVVLLRSLKGWSDTFAAILKEEGIPAFIGTREGYFSSWEVSTILDYLKILDNLRQDIPLASVLRSPFAGLTAQELAEVKAAYPEEAFYRAVRRYANEHTEAAAGRKLAAFFDQVTHYRSMVPYTSIHELLFRILTETGYENYVTAMPGGRQRRANLDMLVEKALAFEATSYKGLFHFVRYMNQLQKYDVDYGEANLMEEQEDVVRLMSIHKSKGLEFPIVFVSGIGKTFNTQDVRSTVVLHPRLGIGVDAVDLTLRTKAPVLLKKVMQRELTLENLGEELRILYVAMTRAKEKLILTGTAKNLEGRLASLAAVRDQAEMELGFLELTKAKSYLDWILPALIRHQSFAPVLKACGLTVPFLNPLFRKEVPIRAAVAEPEQYASEGEERRQEKLLEHEWLSVSVQRPGSCSEAMRANLEAQFAYQYPKAHLIGKKRKYTVTELKKMRYPEGEAELAAGEILYPEQPEAAPLGGAERGTAYHRALELLPFERLKDSLQADELSMLLDSFVQGGRMAAEMRAAVREEDLMAFLETDLAQRMKRAASAGRLHKEQPFVLGLTEDGEEDMFLVQGIMDAWFEEEDGLVLLDYKTDRVKSPFILLERYTLQLEYYAKALTRITGKPVKEKWIYAFHFRKELEV